MAKDPWDSFGVIEPGGAAEAQPEQQPQQADPWASFGVLQQQPTQPVQPAAPETRGRIQPQLGLLAPTPGDITRPSREELQQRAGSDDLNIGANIVNNFSAGIESVKDAISAVEDKNRPWYERTMGVGAVAFGGVQTVSAPVSALLQTAGGLAEKYGGGYVWSGDVQTLAGILGIFSPGKAALKGGTANVRLVEPIAGTKPSPINPITYSDGSLPRDVPRSEAARTGIPEVDALLKDKTIAAAMDNAIPDRSHTIPYEAGGSVPLENPTTYIDKHVPETFTVRRLSASQTVRSEINRYFNDEIGYDDLSHGTKSLLDRMPADIKDAGFSVAQGGSKFDRFLTESDILDEDITDELRAGREESNRKDAKKFGEWLKDNLAGGKTVTFDTAEPIAIHENIEEPVMDMLIKAGWSPGKAYQVAHFGWAEPAEQAWYRYHDIDPAAAEAEWKKLQPGIQHEIANETPTDLYRKEYPGGSVTAARHEDVFESPPTAEELEEARAVIRANSGPRITGGTADQPDLYVAKDWGIIGPERPPATEGTPFEAARNAVPPITAYHGSSHSFDAFDIGRIGTGQGAQSYGHGLYFAESRAVAESYKFEGGDISINGRLYNPNDPLHKAVSLVDEFGSRENALVEAQKLRETDIGSFWDDVVRRLQNDRLLPALEGDQNVYQVHIHADRERFLDWDKPLSEQSDDVLQKLANVGGTTVEKLKQSSLKTGDWLDAAGGGAHGFAFSDPAEMSKALHEAGIPGIKYLDQGSRAQKTLADEEAAIQVQSDKIKNYNPTHNFVVFDHNDVEITHKNGEPTKPPIPPTPPPPPPPPGGEGPPAGEPPNPARDKAGNIRLDQIGINADAKDVIIKAAEANDDFMNARKGNVPLSQISSLSEASGIPSLLLEGNLGLGRLMKNDAVVRTWLQAFHQASDEIAAQMAKVKLSGADEDINALREMKLRFQHMQEQVSGLTAEAGKTLRVFRDFYESKGKAEAIGKLLEDNPGNDAETLKKMADAGAELDRTQLPRWLASQRLPNWWDWAMFYWVNALISGPITHTKYVLANSVFAGFEHGVVTPIAAMVGKTRQLTGLGADEHVMLGEAPAAIWGMLQGTPDAVVAAAKAFKSGMKTPTPGDIFEATEKAKERGLPPPTADEIASSMSPFTGTRMISAGPISKVIGVPMRSAAGIHSFFNFIGYAARIHRDAYRAAIGEGVTPTQDVFYSRLAHHVDNPSEATMKQAIDDGARTTFMRNADFGSWNQKLTSLVNHGWFGTNFAPLKLIIPFTKIPFDLMRSTVESSPLALTTLPFKSSELGAALRGERGGVAQDTAIGRVIGGSALMAWAVNWYMNDRITGDGPIDQKERELWLLNHQPNSVRIGDTWVSFDKFGPAGNLTRLAANFGEVFSRAAGENDEDMATAAGMAVHATANLVMNEVGMMGLADMIQAATDPGRHGARFTSNFVSSWLPYSSFQGQVASWMDPEMRQVKSFTDGLKNRIPAQRQTLYPVRDWSGQAVPNPAYHDIIRQRPVNQDPVDLELQNLNYAPAPPTDRINAGQGLGSVKLSPRLADEYKARAGALTRHALEQFVQQPGWYNNPPFAREKMIKDTIKGARQTATAWMQAHYSEIIQQGVENKLNAISSIPPKPLQQ